MFTFADRTINTVILDRDGVINKELGDYVKSISQWEWLEGSKEAIVSLHKAGLNVFVATNQAGVGRSLYSEDTLREIHENMIADIHAAGGRLHQTLENDIDAVFYCPHHPATDCDCRKPKPGMLHDIANQHQVDLKSACFVGDSQRDLEAAIDAGAVPVHVNSGKHNIQTDTFVQQHNIAEFDSLQSFVETLLK